MHYKGILGLLLVSASFIIFQNCGSFESMSEKARTFSTLPSINDPDINEKTLKHVEWDRDASGQEYIEIESDGLTVTKDDQGLLKPASAYANVSIDHGRWYFEFEVLEKNADTLRFGIAATTGRNPVGTPTSDATYGYESFGQLSIYQEEVFQFAGNHETVDVGDIVSVAIDHENNMVGFYVNGVRQAQVAFLDHFSYSPHFYGYEDDNGKVRANFGAQPFKTSIPDGFKPLDQLLSEDIEVYQEQDSLRANEQSDFIKYVSRSRSDRLWGSVATKDFGLVGFGDTTSYSSSASEADGLVFKTNLLGSKDWALNVGSSNAYEMLFDGFEDSNGDLYLAGLSSQSGNDQGLLVRLSESGAFKWGLSIGSASSQETVVSLDNWGENLIIAGKLSVSSGPLDGYVAKVSKSGQVLWQKSVGGSGDDYFEAGRSLKDGSAVLVGSAKSYGDGSEDAWIVKINSEGTVLWSKNLGGPQKDIFNDAVELENGQILAVGGTESLLAGQGGEDIFLALFSSQGELIATRAFGSSGDDHASNVIVSAGGGLIISGVTENSDDGLSNGFILKVPQHLNSIVWGKILNQNGLDRMFKTREGSDYRLTVSGFSDVGGQNSAFMGLIRANGGHSSSCLSMNNNHGFKLNSDHLIVQNLNVSTASHTNNKTSLTSGVVKSGSASLSNTCRP